MKNKKENLEGGITDKDKIKMIFGLCFFAILFCLAMFGGDRDANKHILDYIKEDNNNLSNGDTSSGDNDGDSFGFGNIFKKIKNNNYKYTYTCTINNSIEIIDGMVYNNKKKFTIFSNGHQEYGQISDGYLVYKDGNYVTVDGEIRDYFKYLNIDDIIEIIDLSFLTDDDSYSFDVSVIDLLEKYNDVIDNENEFEDDSITVEVSGNDVKSILIDYSNYFTYINGEETVFKVKMEFSNYGEVEDFTF